MTTETFMPVPGTTYQGPMMPKFILTKEITFGAKVMYAVLCDCAAYYKADSCYPSHKKLAEKLSCSVSSVKRYLAELTRVKLVKIELREQTSNIYYILKPESAVADTDADAVSEQYNMDSPQVKVNHPQSKVDYASNLITKPEEEKNPPLSPVTADQPRTASAPQASSARGGDSFFADFERLWEAYPKKEAFDGARTLWRKMRKSGLLPSLADLLASVKRFSATTQWQKDNGRYIPQLINFLRKRLWLDPLSVEEAEASRKRLEVEQRELARRQTEEAEAARSREKRERLRPIFEAFAECFEDDAWKTNDRLDAFLFGTWMHSYSVYAGPTAADVPDGTDSSIGDFMDSYKRQRASEAYRTSHQAAQRAVLPAHNSHSDNRESKPVFCADILSRFIPAPQTLCAAV